MLAVDESDGTLMSSPDYDAWGQPVETLDISIGTSDRPASLADLKDAFKKPNEVVSIGMGGENYSAVRLNVNDVLMLMMSPVEGFKGVLEGAVAIRELLLLVITGIGAIYACFQIKGTDGKTVRQIGRLAWNTHLFGRLTACVALLCTAALVSSLFMEAVFVRAEAFEYNRNKARGAATRSISCWRDARK